VQHRRIGVSAYRRIGFEELRRNAAALMRQSNYAFVKR
jgi:hypothetical protein